MDFRRSGSKMAKVPFMPERPVRSRTERIGHAETLGFAFLSQQVRRGDAVAVRMHKQDTGSPVPENRPCFEKGYSPAVYRITYRLGRLGNWLRRETPELSRPKSRLVLKAVGQGLARTGKSRRATIAHTRLFLEVCHGE